MQKFILILFVGVLGVWVATQTKETSVVIGDVMLENGFMVLAIRKSLFAKRWRLLLIIR